MLITLCTSSTNGGLRGFRAGRFAFQQWRGLSFSRQRRTTSYLCMAGRVANACCFAVRKGHKPMSTAVTHKRKQPESVTADGRQEKARKQDSHLYTDDNPSTTLHGTGFQDSVVAQRTIDLVQKRSLTYQFQVINTMFYRAKHHPHPNARMEGAMTVFSEWLNSYPDRKKQLPDYKKASRPLVQGYLEAIEQHQLHALDSELPPTEPFQQALTWARTYVNMPPGKRLANTLTCKDPQEPDMESLRLNNLQRLVPQDSKERDSKAWSLSEDHHKTVSDLHLQWILWGFTPAEKQALIMLRALTSTSGSCAT